MRLAHTGTVLFIVAALCLLISNIAAAQDDVQLISANESPLDISIYGHIKLDASYDTHRSIGSELGNRVRFVSYDEDDDPESNITARYSRLGVRSNWKLDSSLSLTALIEMDWANEPSGTSEVNPTPRMRHAVGFLNYSDPCVVAPHGSWMRFGQYWDIFGGTSHGAVGQTFNFWVLWFGGNIGFRRPQIAIGNTLAPDSAGLSWEFGLFRNIGQSNNGQDTGEDAAMPHVQARFGWTTMDGAKEASTIGVSAVFGQEEFDGVGNGGDDETFPVFGVALDAKYPLGGMLTVIAQAYYGQNLDAYLAGQGYGVYIDMVTPDNNEALTALGGMLNLVINQMETLDSKFALGFGYDSVDGDNFPEDSSYRESTMNVFFNWSWFFTESGQVYTGPEVQYMSTTYRDGESFENIRILWTFVMAWK